jgi:hypothetical protein
MRKIVRFEPIGTRHSSEEGDGWNGDFACLSTSYVVAHNDYLCNKILPMLKGLEKTDSQQFFYVVAHT